MHQNSDNSLAIPISKVENLCLIQIRKKLKESNNEKHFIFPNPYMDDDAFLLGFLRKMKYDIDRSFSCISTNVEMIRAYPEVFAQPPSAYKYIHDTKHSIPLRYRDEHGRQILLTRPGKLDSAKHPIFDLFCSNFPIVDTLSKRQLTQLHGIVLIVDFNDVGFSHLQTVPLKMLKLLSNITNISPFRVKGIHIVNNSIITGGIWKIMQGFLKPKIRNRVHIHGFNTHSLHKYFSPEILPKEYGGKLSIKEALEPNFIENILTKDEYYAEIFKEFINTLNCQM